MATNELQKSYIIIKHEGMLLKIQKDEVILIETTKKPHQLQLISQTDTIRFSGKIKYYDEALGDQFQKISSSCLVNKQAIQAIDMRNREVLLNNKLQRSISRRQYSVIKSNITEII